MISQGGPTPCFNLSSSRSGISPSSKVQSASGGALATVDMCANDEGQELQNFVSHFYRRVNRLLGYTAHSDTKQN